MGGAGVGGGRTCILAWLWPSEPILGCTLTETVSHGVLNIITQTSCRVFPARVEAAQSGKKGQPYFLHIPPPPPPDHNVPSNIAYMKLASFIPNSLFYSLSNVSLGCTAFSVWMFDFFKKFFMYLFFLFFFVLVQSDFSPCVLPFLSNLSRAFGISLRRPTITAAYFSVLRSVRLNKFNEPKTSVAIRAHNYL